MSHVTLTKIHVTLMSESCHTYERVMSHIRTSHVTPRHMNESCFKHMNESCHTYE